MDVDFKVLDKFSDQKTVNAFNKEIESFLDGKTKAASREAIAYFYLTLHKIENEIFSKLQYADIQHLEGKMLTIIDASISDNRHNKAVKDLIRRAIWFDWAQNLDRSEKELPLGMPMQEEL